MEINGITYKKREQVIASGGRSVGKMFALLQTFGVIKNQKDLGVNIVEEFKLIQEKRSLLSRADRELVERQFNCAYDIVT